MEPKIESHNFVRSDGCWSTDTKLISIMTPEQKMKKKVFKFKYRNGNAFEEFSGELFNGSNLNLIFSLRDLGVKPNNSAYQLMSETEVKERIEMLTTKGIEFIKLLF